MSIAKSSYRFIGRRLFDISASIGARAGRSTQRAGLPQVIEPLESRTLLAGVTVGVYTGRAEASETDPAGAGRGSFIIKRPSGPTADPLAVEYYIRNTSTATNGADFQTISGQITIPAGRRTALVHIIPIDDSAVEATETVTLVLKPGAGPIVHRSASVSILDNDQAPGVTLGVYTGLPVASETDPTGAGRGSFVIKRPSGSTADPLDVEYYIRSTSTATNTSDFQTLSGTATIPAGQRSVLVHVIPVDDDDDEPTETLTLALNTGAFTIVHRQASVSIGDNDEPSSVPQGWWDENWHYRSEISVDVGSTARTDQPVDRSINFTSILSGLSAGGSLITDSIRVIETSADGETVLDDSVPFQFDEAAGFNASSNATGTLVFLLDGNTAANATRYYHVYFDTNGSFSAPAVSPLVSTTDDVSDQGYSSVRITTDLATYYYQKEEGGFSSIVDANGNDWVAWSATAGSAGEYRGIPNLGNVGFHPGRDHDITTTIVSSGPIKTTLESTDAQGNQVRWEFYPTFARLTVVSMNQDYWFLYEGTPGGSLGGSDSVVRSDGTATTINEEWADTNGLGNGTTDEWIYFRDSAVGGSGRYIYLVHNTVDAIEDSYWNMEDNMTVFGFGRYTSMPDHNVSTPLLSADNNIFTIGIADGGSSFNSARDVINGVYKDLSASLGTAEAIE